MTETLKKKTLCVTPSGVLQQMYYGLTSHELLRIRDRHASSRMMTSGSRVHRAWRPRITTLSRPAALPTRSGHTLSHTVPVLAKSPEEEEEEEEGFTARRGGGGVHGCNSSIRRRSPLLRRTLSLLGPSLCTCRVSSSARGDQKRRIWHGAREKGGAEERTGGNHCGGSSGRG